MPESNAEKIKWEGSIEQKTYESGEMPENRINAESAHEISETTEGEAAPVESLKAKNNLPENEIKIENQELESQLGLLLREIDLSEESGERKIQNLIKKIAENLILKNDHSASRTAEDKDQLIERLSEGNLSTYGYLQEIFNEEIGTKLSRKNF